MKLIFLGPPGAGKGTHAEVLAERLNLFRISTGDILRQNVKDKTTLGESAKEYMDRGALVPDEEVIQMVLDEISKAEANKGFILDGFPRTIPQAQHLDESLAGMGDPLDLAINFETSESTIIERLSGRRICRGCGANYHIKNLPPRNPGACDRCGDELFQREDDEPHTIKKRLEIYKESASGVIDFYKQKGILETVSGDLDIERGYKALTEVLTKRGLL